VFKTLVIKDVGSRCLIWFNVIEYDWYVINIIIVGQLLLFVKYVVSGHVLVISLSETEVSGVKLWQIVKEMMKEKQCFVVFYLAEYSFNGNMIIKSFGVKKIVIKNKQSGCLAICLWMWRFDIDRICLIVICYGLVCIWTARLDDIYEILYPVDQRVLGCQAIMTVEFVGRKSMYYFLSDNEILVLYKYDVVTGVFNNIGVWLCTNMMQEECSSESMRIVDKWLFRMGIKTVVLFGIMQCLTSTGIVYCLRFKQNKILVTEVFETVQVSIGKNTRTDVAKNGCRQLAKVMFYDWVFKDLTKVNLCSNLVMFNGAEYVSGDSNGLCHEYISDSVYDWCQDVLKFVEYLRSGIFSLIWYLLFIIDKLKFVAVTILVNLIYWSTLWYNGILWRSSSLLINSKYKSVKSMQLVKYVYAVISSALGVTLFVNASH
jgi:hypothetical protein